MKTFVLSCVGATVLAFLAGCADEPRTVSTTTTEEATVVHPIHPVSTTTEETTTIQH